MILVVKMIVVCYQLRSTIFSVAPSKTCNPNFLDSFILWAIIQNDPMVLLKNWSMAVGQRGKKSVNIVILQLMHLTFKSC